MKNTTLCYIEKDGAYLMLHRNKKENDLNEGKWIGVGGHMEEGETPEACIRREILEETGLSVKFIDGFRESIEYSPYEGCIKTVIFFLAGTDSMDVTAQEEEVKEIKWLPFPEAMADLTFDSDRETLRKAEEFLRKNNL